MKYTNIYFDEAGNSGDNLLDKDQPIYVLSSNNYTDDEVQKILLPLNDINSEELHFNRLKKFSKNQNKLLEVLNSDLLDSSRIKIYYADKKYALICRIVDGVIEPFFFKNGVDLYKHGQNIIYANLLYMIYRSIKDKDLFDDLLESYQLLMRNKKNDHLVKFYQSVNDILKKGKSNKLINHVFTIMANSKITLQSLVESSDKYNLDLAMTIFVAQCTVWDDELMEKFNVIHDNSKPMDYWSELIMTLSSDKIPRTEVGYDYRKHKYPLMINKLDFADSANYKQIQLADIISSAIAYCIKTRNINNIENNAFANAIFGSKLFQLSVNNLWPSTKLTPEELGTMDSTGIDAINFVGDITKDFFDKNK